MVRVSNDRFPHIAMNGYVHGMRSRGRPKKRWIDTIREDCDEMKVDLHTATDMAHDRRQWRESVNELLTRVDETSLYGSKSNNLLDAASNELIWSTLKNCIVVYLCVGEYISVVFPGLCWLHFVK